MKGMFEIVVNNGQTFVIVLVKKSRHEKCFF
jgi:hypothetical protein